MKVEYLLFNIIVFTSSSAGIGLYKNGRYPKTSPAILSILSVGSLFVLWDQLVSGKWWWFNSKYVLGFYIGNLPLEEVLFFLVVPWSCLVIWENLKRYFTKSTSKNIELIFIIFSFMVAAYSLFQGWWYTLAASTALMAVFIISILTFKWFRKKAAWVFLLLTSVLTVVFNGYLTARPIVLYSPEVKSGVQLGTIPVEDVVYGLSLLSAVAIFYEFILKLRR